MNPTELLHQLGLDDHSAERWLEIPGIGAAWGIEMEQERSFDRWSVARTRGAPLGWIPVAVGSQEEYTFLTESEPRRTWDVDAWRAKATSVDLGDWIRRRRQKEHPTLPRDSWPDDVEPSSGFYFPFDSDGHHLANWWMILVPAHYDWEVPLHLGWGGHDESPEPAIHAAFLRRWLHRFDAELVAMTSDTMELAVARPPSTRKEALDLAIEQYIYSPDIVDQGVGSVDALAATLLDGATWFFWWD